LARREGAGEEEPGEPGIAQLEGHWFDVAKLLQRRLSCAGDFIDPPGACPEDRRCRFV
jgi:hypothetical protein